MSFQSLQKSTTKNKDNSNKLISHKNTLKYKNYQHDQYYHYNNDIAISNNNFFDKNAIQRKSICSCDGGCPSCKSEIKDTTMLNIQPKLKVSQPNDPLEREADRVAEQILAISDNEENKISKTCNSCNNKGNHKIQISRKNNTNRNLEVSNSVVSEIKNIIGSSGKPLDSGTKDFMESIFDHDFSNVKTHNDKKSSDSAAKLNSIAYTIGNDIFFSKQYKSYTQEGKKLLAHELTHVVQKSSNNIILRKKDNESRSNENDTKNTIIKSLKTVAKEGYKTPEIQEAIDKVLETLQEKWHKLNKPEKTGLISFGVLGAGIIGSSLSLNNPVFLLEQGSGINIGKPLRKVPWLLIDRLMYSLPQKGEQKMKFRIGLSSHDFLTRLLRKRRIDMKIYLDLELEHDFNTGKTIPVRAIGSFTVLKGITFSVGLHPKPIPFRETHISETGGMFEVRERLPKIQSENVGPIGPDFRVMFSVDLFKLGESELIKRLGISF